MAKHLPTPEQRTAFCSGVGEQLLQQMMPDAQQRLRRAAQKGEPLDMHGLSASHCRADLFDMSVLHHAVYCTTCLSGEWQPVHTDAAPCLLGYAHTGGSSSQQAPAAAVLSELQQLLQRLQQSSYICGYQLVWGSLPGGWPGDWAVSEPQFVDAEDVLQQPEPIAGGSVFQVGETGLLLLAARGWLTRSPHRCVWPARAA